MGRSRKKQPDGPVQPENSDQSVNINRADSGTAEESKKTGDGTEVVKNAAKDDARENAPKAGKDLSGEPEVKKSSAAKDSTAIEHSSAIKEVSTIKKSSVGKTPSKEQPSKEQPTKEPVSRKASSKKVPAKESAATQDKKKEIKKVPSRERPRSRKAADSQNHPVEVREVPEAGKKTAGNSDTRGRHSRKQGQASEQAPGQAPVESRDRRRSASRGKQSAADNELRRYILLLSVPLIALILVVVLLISGNFRGSGEAVTAAPSRHSVDTLPENAEIPVIEPDTKEYFHDFGGSILSQDTVPEINQLMEQYFLATTDCDMGTFLHLFTSQDTSEEERFRQDFEKQKQYIEGYRNISCYTTPGLDENSYAAYVYYEIKYVGVETPAPSLVQIYAVKGDDGIYRIYDQEMSPELEDFLEQLSVNEDVRLLISQVDQQAEEAMAADPALNERIQYMKQGPDYMREEETQAPETQEGDQTQQ